MMLENNGHIHIDSLRAGADNTLGSFFFKNIILLSFSASFPPLNDTNSFLLSKARANKFDLAIK